MDGHAQDGARNFRGGRDGEEQFVVFAAVKGQVEGRRRIRRAAAAALQFEGQGVDGQRGFIERGGQARGAADMGEVGGKAVADVDHGGRQGAEALAGGQARLGIEVRMTGFGAGEGAEALWVTRECEEFGGGSAEGAGDAEEIAGARRGAKTGRVARKLAEGDDVGEDFSLAFSGSWRHFSWRHFSRRLRGVAAGERDAMLAGEGQEAVEETVEPGGGKAHGQGEREEDGEGLGAHGGQIAESAGEAAMADGLGRMPVAAEVDVFEGKVGGDADFVAGSGAKNGAVVADAEAHSAWDGNGRGLAADGVNEGEFAFRRIGRRRAG